MFSLCLIEPLVVVDVIGTKPRVAAKQAINERAIGLKELSLKKRKVKLCPIVCHQTDRWVEAAQKGRKACDQVGIEPSLFLQLVVAESGDVLNMKGDCGPWIDTEGQLVHNTRQQHTLQITHSVEQVIIQVSNRHILGNWLLTCWH